MIITGCRNYLVYEYACNSTKESEVYSTERHNTSIINDDNKYSQKDRKLISKSRNLSLSSSYHTVRRSRPNTSSNFDVLCVRLSVHTYGCVIAIVGQSSFTESVALICVRDDTEYPSLAVYLWPLGLRISRCSSTQRLKLVLLLVASQRHFSIHTVLHTHFSIYSKIILNVKQTRREVQFCSTK